MSLFANGFSIPRIIKGCRFDRQPFDFVCEGVTPLLSLSPFRLPYGQNSEGGLISFCAELNDRKVSDEFDAFQFW
jgi:hypothetical protein